MPAVILLLWGVQRLQKLRHGATAALWIAIAFVALKQIASRQRSPHKTLPLPAGQVLVPQEDAAKLSWLLQHTRPGDLFFQAQGVSLYLPFELRSPVFVDGLWTGEVTRPEYVQLTIQQIQQHRVRYILWSPRLAGPNDPQRYGQDHLGPFRDLLAGRYIRVQDFSDGDEIWELR